MRPFSFFRIKVILKTGFDEVVLKDVTRAEKL